MSETYNIQIAFERETEYGTFSDALNFTVDEFFNETPETIKAAQDQRVANWIDFITNPPQLPEPTEEQKQRFLDQIRKDRENLDALLAQG